jgi:hypothetical protein
MNNTDNSTHRAITIDVPVPATTVGGGGGSSGITGVTAGANGTTYVSVSPAVVDIVANGSAFITVTSLIQNPLELSLAVGNNSVIGDYLSSVPSKFYLQGLGQTVIEIRASGIPESFTEETIYLVSGGSTVGSFKVRRAPAGISGLSLASVGDFFDSIKNALGSVIDVGGLKMYAGTIPVAGCLLLGVYAISAAGSSTLGVILIIVALALAAFFSQVTVLLPK